MPAGAFGAVRPVGAILPTATAAGPIPLTKPRTATPLRRLLTASNVWMANISMPGHANMTMLVSYSYEKANTTRRGNVIRI